MVGLARLSLASRSLVVMIALVLSGVGIYAIPQLKQQMFPSLNLPMVTVMSSYPGASPEVVEEQVTKPIENSLQGLEDLEEITSTSGETVSSVMASFDFEVEVDDVVADIQEAVNGISGELPEDVEPTVAAGGTDDIPVIVLAAVNGGDEQALLDKLESTAVPELSRIPDVQDVEVTGARANQVVITPDDEKMEEAGLSPTAITDALQANGVTAPAGSLTQDDMKVSVQVGDKLSRVEDVEELYLTPQAAPGGADQAGEPAQGAQQPPDPVKLGDVAEVELGPEEATSVTRTNGEASLGLSITMTSDGNAVGISHEVNDKLDDLQESMGSEVELSVIFDQAPAIESSIEDLTVEGALGLAFAVIVIMVFLLSLRSTLVTAVSIPLSLVIALIALWLGDYSLNMLTLGALTISVGRVVDDSIVVLENIKRHLGYGEPKREAVLNGVREVAGAVTSSTLTTVAVFLPIAFVAGMVGQLFSSFAVTVTVALLASLLVSLTVIPVLAYWFLKAPKGDSEEQAAIRERAEAKELRSPLQRMYMPVLRFATRFKLVTVAIGIVVLVGTVALIPGLKTNFLDSSGQDTTMINQTLPAGTDLSATEAAAAKIEDVLADLHDEGEIAEYQANIGGGNAMFGGMGGGENKASFSITIPDDVETPDVEDRLREEIEGMSGLGEVAVGSEGGGPEGGNAVEVVVRGSDPDSLRAAAADVEYAVEGIDGVRDVASTIEDAAPRIQVSVDREKAAEAGLTEAAIGQMVAQHIQGAPAGEMVIEGDASEIVLAQAGDPADVDDVRQLEIGTAAGPVELQDVAEVEEVEGPVQISHFDGDRSATISAAVDASDLGAVTAELTDDLEALDLPQGASYEIGGSSADQEEAFSDLLLAMVIAVALVFMVMVATFRSLLQPLILLVSIPFAATGAIGMLRLTDVPLGVPGMVGMLMLIGIVVTNAIVLIDLINQYRAQGMGVREAVVAGGRRRLRPILMTAVATICALTPMALGLTGSSAFIAQGLAVVVIGGLVSSTLLTLLLVPTLYAIVELTKERLRTRRETKRRGRGNGAEAILRKRYARGEIAQEEYDQRLAVLRGQ